MHELLADRTRRHVGDFRAIEGVMQAEEEGRGWGEGPAQVHSEYFG